MFYGFTVHNNNYCTILYLQVLDIQYRWSHMGIHWTNVAYYNGKLESLLDAITAT